MKKAFVKIVSALLVCLFVISGINFSLFAASGTAELGEKLSAINVEVSGKISLMFYFKNLKDVSYFKVTVPNRDGSSTTNTVEVSDLRYDSTKDRYLLKVALAAAQQTDKVEVQAFNADNVGSEKIYEYSIRDYADMLFDLVEANPDNETYSAVATTVKFMLNYGAMAQMHFGYNVNDLANKGLYYEGTNPVYDMSGKDMYGIGESRFYTSDENVIKFTSANAYPEDMVYLRFYFEYNGDVCDTKDLTVTINSVVYKNEVLQDEEGKYYVLINNIPATCFNDQYQVRISDGTAYAEISYSVLNYLQKKLELDDDESFADVAYSMFQFYVSSSAHADKDVPEYDSMAAACTHERSYIDAQDGGSFICSDCGHNLTIDAEYATDFTVAKIFSNNMVVQRGEYLRVWGFAPESENGKKISGEFKGMIAETLIKNGEWCLTFSARLDADTKGAEMTISAGTNKTVTFSDVLVGDVYLVLGQSNAALALSDTITGSGVNVDIDENSIIRLNYLNGGGGTYAEKGTDYVYKDLENITLWTKTTEAQANRFSAIGYHFAQEMVARSNNTVPVGLMEVAYGGAPLASFLPNDIAERYDSDYYNNETGKYVSMRDANHLGRYLYNCYLAPASRYSVAGVLWYQGESDNPLSFAQVYGDVFADLIERLRSTHNVINKEFPVFVVEFPTQYQKPENYTGTDTWHYLEVGTIRTYQGLLPTKVDNLYLSASSDLWDDKEYTNNLHPYCKAAQAERLADIAEFVIFGNGSLDEATGPIYKSHQISDDGMTVTITFTNVGDGLTTADGGKAVKGILGFADKPYAISTVTPTSATITANNQITVKFSEAVKAVVYNYNTSDFYGETLNLCNSAKIPALAFITPYEEDDLGSYESGDFKTTSDASVSHKQTAIDTIKVNGKDLFEPGHVVEGLEATGNSVSLVEGTTMLSVSGWTGFDYEALLFGYSIDGNNAIFNTYPSDASKEVTNAGGQYAKRFTVNMDISGLSVGEHTVDVLVLVNVNEGTAVKLLSFTIVVVEPGSEPEPDPEPDPEPTIPDGYDAPLFNASDYGVIGESVDLLKVDDVEIYEGDADTKLAAAGNTLTVTLGAQKIRLTGWIGFGTTIEKFGYAIDGSAVIETTPSTDNIQALINAGKGENVRRYNVYVDISGLSAGYHTIDLLVRINTADGSTVVLKMMESFTLVIAEPVNNIDAVYPENGDEVILANKEIYSWWKKYNLDNTEYPDNAGEDLYYPVPVTLQWQCKEEAAYYLVYVSANEDLSGAMSFVTNKPTVKLENLLVGYNYYWQVDAICGGQTLRSEVFTFSTAISPRTVFIEGVSNTRDIGGMTLTEGYRIKQGMIYRGGKLEGITEKGKQQFLYGLGIKTDLDLRTPGEGGAGSGSPVGEGVNYINIDGRYYADLNSSKDVGIHTDKGKELMAQEIKVFADKNNYPIYIHCSLGRDRTGTLAFIIEALLGADVKTLIMDYDMSVFSYTGTYDGAIYSENLRNSIMGTYNYLNDNYEGNTFSEKVENYLLEIGVKADDIATIRSLLTEEVK